MTHSDKDESFINAAIKCREFNIVLLSLKSLKHKAHETQIFSECMFSGSFIGPIIMKTSTAQHFLPVLQFAAGEGKIDIVRFLLDCRVEDPLSSFGMRELIIELIYG
jgi:hypothetical protein